MHLVTALKDFLLRDSFKELAHKSKIRESDYTSHMLCACFGTQAFYVLTS